MTEPRIGRKLSSVVGRWRGVLDTLATALLIVVAGLLLKDRFYGATVRAQPSKVKVSVPRGLEGIQGAPSIGEPNSKIVIIEYSDFQCPFCARFAKETLSTLSTKYIRTGNVALVFRNNPLQSIHTKAFDAAIAADCAGRQSRFWEVHDRLFQKQAEASQWNLADIARAAGVDMKGWSECIAGVGKDSVSSDQRHAAALGVSTTPVFFIGLRQNQDSVKVTDVIEGARPAQEFEHVIERLLRTS